MMCVSEPRLEAGTWMRSRCVHLCVCSRRPPLCYYKIDTSFHRAKYDRLPHRVEQTYCLWYEPLNTVGSTPLSSLRAGESSFKKVAVGKEKTQRKRENEKEKYQVR